jgi:hypothetical protein
MKTFEVKGWYRYGDNQKDYVYESIEAEYTQQAIALFISLHNDRNFFAIDVKEIE